MGFETLDKGCITGTNIFDDDDSCEFPLVHSFF